MWKIWPNFETSMWVCFWTYNHHWARFGGIIHLYIFWVHITMTKCFLHVEKWTMQNGTNTEKSKLQISLIASFWLKQILKEIKMSIISLLTCFMSNICIIFTLWGWKATHFEFYTKNHWKNGYVRNLKLHGPEKWRFLESCIQSRPCMLKHVMTYLNLVEKLQKAFLRSAWDSLDRNVLPRHNFDSIISTKVFSEAS